MAALIRSSYHGAMTLPNLQSSEPLEILAEIGIEKLRRDYRNTFIGEKAFFSSDSDHFRTVFCTNRVAADTHLLAFLQTVAVKFCLHFIGCFLLPPLFTEFKDFK